MLQYFAIGCHHLGQMSQMVKEKSRLSYVHGSSLYTMLRRWRRGVLVSSLLVFHFGPESQRVLSSSYSSEFIV